MNTKLITMMSVAILGSAIMSGCGKSEQATNAADNSTAQANQKSKNVASGTPTATEMKKEVASASSLPSADKSTAEDVYVKLDSGSQVAYLYYAVSGMPVDYERLARAASSEFRSTTDEFKKKELLDALKPRIDQQLAYFKDHRYVKMDSRYQIQHIDMATKSFPVTGIPSEKEYIYFNDDPSYKVGLTNGDKFGRYTATSDEQARELEGQISKYQNQGDAEMYLFAQDADINSNTVKFQAVKVKLKSSKGGAVIGEII